MNFTNFPLFVYLLLLSSAVFKSFGIICYINMGHRYHKDELGLMEESECSVCSLVRRYKIPMAVLNALRENPSKDVGTIKPIQMMPSFICFTTTATLDVCEYQCMRERETAPDNEFIEECRCCETDRCNDSVDNRKAKLVSKLVPLFLFILLPLVDLL